MWLLLVNHMWSLHKQFLCLSLAMTKLWMKFWVWEKKQYHPAGLPLLPLLSRAWNGCDWQTSETCGAFCCSWLMHSGGLVLLSLLGWCWVFSLVFNLTGQHHPAPPLCNALPTWVILGNIRLGSSWSNTMVFQSSQEGHSVAGTQRQIT